MKSFKSILFPVDLSETSAKLVPYVLTMAAKFDAAVHLLFVARVLQYFTGIYVPHPSIAEFERALLDGAEKRLYEFKEEHFASLPQTRNTVVLGDASEEILRYVETHGIELLILGTHGRKGLDRVVFGSVAERVVKAAPVPVLVINPYRVKA